VSPLYALPAGERRLEALRLRGAVVKVTVAPLRGMTGERWEHVGMHLGVAVAPHNGAVSDQLILEEYRPGAPRLLALSLAIVEGLEELPRAEGRLALAEAFPAGVVVPPGLVGS
jgi:hypothetical protein